MGVLGREQLGVIHNTFSFIYNSSRVLGTSTLTILSAYATLFAHRLCFVQLKRNMISAHERFDRFVLRWWPLFFRPSSSKCHAQQMMTGAKVLKKMFRHQLICIFILHPRHHKNILVAMLDSNSAYCYWGSTSFCFCKRKHLVSLAAFNVFLGTKQTSVKRPICKYMCWVTT